MLKTVCDMQLPLEDTADSFRQRTESMDTNYEMGAGTEGYHC